jgi:H+/Cl- antiporter ClcA
LAGSEADLEGLKVKYFCAEFEAPSSSGVSAGAFCAGVSQAPIAAAVIIGEMTAADGMRLPLLLAALISYAFSRLIQRKSLYHPLAEHLLKE